MVKDQPSKLKYIGAWFLFSAVAGVLLVILDSILAETMVEDISDLNFYFFVGATFSIPIYVGTFILVYRWLSSLSIKRVVPFLYVFSTIGTLANMGKVKGELRDLNVDLSVFYGSSLFALIASIYLIRAYFIKKPDRWF
jgi:hypothetical protein